jgi:hypothetical protein
LARIAFVLVLAGCGQRGPVLVDLDAGADGGVDAGARDASVDGGPDDGGADGGTDGGVLRCPLRQPMPADPTRGLWDTRFHLPGVGGTAPTDVTALALGLRGEVYIGGRFSHGGPVPARNVVRYSALEGFVALGDGLPFEVSALAVDPRDGTLWAATEDGAGGMAIHRFRDAAWSRVASVVGRVARLAIDAAGTLYAAGSFERIGGVDVPRLARFDGTTWSGVGGAPDNEVRALLLERDSLCIGGRFAQVGTVEARSVACWDGARWVGYSLPVESYSVEVLARDATGTLLAGGHFDLEPLDGDEGGSIARWTGTGWERLGGGLRGSAGPGYVEGVVVVGSDVYVAGSFRQAGDVLAESVARWDGTRWHDLGGAFREVGVFLELRNVTQLVRAGDRIYAGGLFTRVANRSASHVAYLDVSGWHPLIGPGQAPAGVNGLVDALAARGDCGVYVGGRFEHVGAVAARNVARVTPLGAQALGDGLDGLVRALAVAPDGTVYAGGDFGLGHVAAWDGERWSAVGGGVDGTIYALLVASDGTLYVGGSFVATAAGNGFVNVAAWDGERWSPLGDGVDGPVYALLELPDGRIAVGGTFSLAGGRMASHVAVWDGTEWASLGTGLPTAGGGGVRALTMYRGELVAGGTFTTLGDGAGRGIARWDGTLWRTLGGGLHRRESWAPVYVNGLAAVGDVLFAVGDLAVEEGGIDVRAAAFDGAAWAPMGAGLTDLAEAAIAAPDGLYLGGAFTSAGGVPAVGLARFRFE